MQFFYLEASSREEGAAAEIAHLTRWWSMLDSHHRVNLTRLRGWSPAALSTGMLFSFWASWAGDW